MRYESSALPAGQLTSLVDYASRMQAGTRNIYYLCTPNRHLAEHSPYFEAMKQKNMEVGEQQGRLHPYRLLGPGQGIRWGLSTQGSGVRWGGVGAGGLWLVENG